jgi:hypothetical protein
MLRQDLGDRAYVDFEDNAYLVSHPTDVQTLYTRTFASTSTLTQWTAGLWLSDIDLMFCAAFVTGNGGT